jgi:hypothetical protein
MPSLNTKRWVKRRPQSTVLQELRYWSRRCSAITPLFAPLRLAQRKAECVVAAPVPTVVPNRRSTCNCNM